MGSEYKPKAYVLTFKGDLFASNLINLREEISAIIRQCNHNRGDTVILKLDSGGGTVTGYGLASSQLLRLRDSGINLTVCVDEVAASGGYMMASVGNTIVAAPFAILGSIGVVTTIPNFSERLKREGVTVFDVTAGKFKRTLTPYKPTTDDDKRKVQDDLENVLNSFKSFLKSSRPNLNVDKLATGETWQGMDALKLGLCDKISTSDDILLDYYNKGYDVLFINHKIKEKKIGLFDLDNSISILVSTFIQEFLKQLQYNNINDNHQNISHSDMFKQRILAIDTKIRPDAGY